LVVGVWVSTSQTIEAQESLADALREFDARVITVGKLRENPLASMLARDAKAALREANLRDAKAWSAVKTRADWETFRDGRIEALRKSLGTFPTPPKELNVRVTRSRTGEGFKIDNVVFESRPGVFVTANLYRPAKLADGMPGMILVHSHHRPKHVGQRQDMAMTWARAGCVVLVPDLLGHGERALHPFTNADAFDGMFRVEMQDYWFRYDLGMQLHLIGDSLMGWMAYDLSRGVDLLLAQPGIDAKRILIVSEPAGGGDVAAVTMALDARITGGVITNFGGPQPETPYPLSRDAEQTFEYAGSGSFESTRNLTRSARDGFLPWTIVASVAPRKLIYNHEFYWDQANDPVWRRLQKVYAFYKADESLEGAAGRGFVAGSAPENWHWLPINREILYPTLERWFDIPNPKTEYSRRRPENELLCMPPESARDGRNVTSIIEQIGNERVQAARARLAALKQEERLTQLRKDWTRLLGNVEPSATVQRIGPDLADLTFAKIRAERHHLNVEPGIVVPIVMFIPAQAKREKAPVVIAVSQAGKQAFVSGRAETVAALLRNGIAVALPDLRGTGETSPGEARDRRSPATSISSTGLLTGQSLLGARLRDLRTVMRYVKKHPELDGKRVAIWGDSFTDPLGPDDAWKLPHGVDDRPAPSEPLGGLLALLAAFYEDDVRAVYAHGGVASYTSALSSPFCYLPHDVIVPGVVSAADLPDVAAALAPRPVRLSGMVDGVNRRVGRLPIEKIYEPARASYRSAEAEQSLVLEPNAPSSGDLARWFATHLAK